MNWRALGAAAVALVFRAIIIAKLGWEYRPFRDPFDIHKFGQDAILTLFLFAVALAIISAVLGPRDEA